MLLSPRHAHFPLHSMAKDADNSSPYAKHLTILIIAASTAALVVLIYHFATVCCNRRIRRRPTPAPPQQQQDPPSSSLDASVAELIPAHKYRKSDDCGGGGRDNTCAVCLCEFEEGEELRTLPECGHSFHADCIDMWLYSHFTCPVCRTDNTPSPLVLRRLWECSRRSDRIEGRSIGPPR